jgi:hypothetical protein
VRTEVWQKLGFEKAFSRGEIFALFFISVLPLSNCIPALQPTLPEFPDHVTHGYMQTVRFTTT